ncbi:MAG: dihydrolipoamide acyltransferase [Candidatus Lokiarchaeota archaeon]|nr:dihydrolipoamide acyltransferase [Candidatus Lokiarchaeota archaeon]
MKIHYIASTFLTSIWKKGHVTGIVICSPSTAEFKRYMLLSSEPGYRKERIPKSRKLIIESCEYALKKHRMLGLFEADVTDARKKIKMYEAEKGESISFTGWIAACVGLAASEHDQVCTLKIGKHFVTFDDVNINILIETVLEGRTYPVNYILEAANTKTVLEITQEIRQAQKMKETDYSEAKENRLLKLLLSAPKFLRDLLFWRKLRKDPVFINENMGTIAVTSIGRFAKSGGWAIPLGMHALNIAVGGIAVKPGFVGDQIEKREFLSITVTFDHDVVDGAPATRFVSRLTELLEEGHGLP